MITIESLRELKISGYAVFDLVVSFVGIYLLSPLLSKLCDNFGFKIKRESWLLLTLPIGILVHLVTGNMTSMTRDFLDPNGHYILKIIILGLLVFGVRGVKKTEDK